jgi:ribosomal protein L24
MREPKEKPAATGIRHGDMVKVMSGRSKGKSGQSAFREFVEGHGHRRAYQHHQEAHAPEPAKNVKGGILEKRRADSRFQRDAGLPGMRKARARGHTKLPDGTKVRICRRCNTTFEN